MTPHLGFGGGLGPLGYESRGWRLAPAEITT